jgi:hypothetical protein
MPIYHTCPIKKSKQLQIAPTYILCASTIQYMKSGSILNHKVKLLRFYYSIGSISTCMRIHAIEIKILYLEVVLKIWALMSRVKLLLFPKKHQILYHDTGSHGRLHMGKRYERELGLQNSQHNHLWL